MSKFKVGDRVRYNQLSAPVPCGARGTVVENPRSTVPVVPDLISVQFDEHGRWWCGENELELVPKSQDDAQDLKFQSGDQVQTTQDVTVPGTKRVIPAGTRGTIKRVEYIKGELYPYDILFEDQPVSFWMSEDGLEEAQDV